MVASHVTDSRHNFEPHTTPTVQLVARPTVGNLHASGVEIVGIYLALSAHM